MIFIILWKLNMGLTWNGPDLPHKLNAYIYINVTEIRRAYKISELNKFNICSILKNRMRIISKIWMFVIDRLGECEKLLIFTLLEQNSLP